MASYSDRARSAMRRDGLPGRSIGVGAPRHPEQNGAAESRRK
jgi:hypothetical protein